jgi:hypothetical protein
MERKARELERVRELFLYCHSYQVRNDKLLP